MSIRCRTYQKGKVNRGASALFIVIFASLLLSLISVSFIGIMIKEQGRSADDEQSQGAYDAAMAGVEDGKRVLLECLRGSGIMKANSCAAINAANPKCSTVIDAGIAGAPGDTEVAVQSASSGGGDELNLAYTCVIVNPNVPDYINVLSSSTSGAGDASLIVPLTPVGSTDVSEIEVSWFTSEDAATPQLPAGGTTELPQLSTATWPAEQPPVLRAQLIQYESGKMSAADFDADGYAHTLYLYPNSIGTNNFNFGTSDPRGGSQSPLPVQCAATYGVDGYLCKATIRLPNVPGATIQRVAYLRLTSIYNNTHVRVVMNGPGGTTYNFNNVQTSIESTGRANDLFRRVETRVEFASDFPYPRATVDVTGNFCKTFTIGSKPSDYDDGGCTP